MKLINVDDIDWQWGTFISNITRMPLPVIHKIATIEMLRDWQEEVKAIPIPKGATNGDMIITLYPNIRYTIQNGRVVTTIGVASSFDLDWWNALYKPERKEHNN